MEITITIKIKLNFSLCTLTAYGGVGAVVPLILKLESPCRYLASSSGLFTSVARTLIQIRAGLEPWDKEETPCPNQNKKIIPCS
jgi:hypothetical protein